MSYFAADANGYIDDIASGGGWSAFVEWGLAKGGAIKEFVEDGVTSDLEGLIAELSGESASGSIESTRRIVLACAEKADEVLIVTDGTSDEDVSSVDDEKAYDHSQPRDDHGRWDDGGGASVRQGELSRSERSSLSRWRGNVSDPDGDFEDNIADDLNGPLRSGQKLDKVNQRHVDALDSAISKGELKKDATFFRGLERDFVVKLKVGSTFTDKGFASVTTKKDTAELFALGSGYEQTDEGEVVRVRVPKGTHALDVTGALGLKRGSVDDEGEHLLPRGTRFKVVTAKKGNVVLEVVRK